MNQDQDPWSNSIMESTILQRFIKKLFIFNHINCYYNHTDSGCMNLACGSKPGVPTAWIACIVCLGSWQEPLLPPLVSEPVTRWQNVDSFGLGLAGGLVLLCSPPTMCSWAELLLATLVSQLWWGLLLSGDIELDCGTWSRHREVFRGRVAILDTVLRLCFILDCLRQGTRPPSGLALGISPDSGLELETCPVSGLEPSLLEINEIACPPFIIR